MDPLVVREPDDLTLAAFEQVVFDDCSPASGGSPCTVNTGMGYPAGIRLNQSEQDAHQRNLLLGRAVGAPFLDRVEARAILLARLGVSCTAMRA